MAAPLTRINTALRTLIAELAARPAGMLSTDGAPTWTTQQTYLCLNRMTGNGTLHTCRDGRKTRWFTTPEARDAWASRRGPQAGSSSNSSNNNRPRRDALVTGLNTARVTRVPTPDNWRPMPMPMQRGAIRTDPTALPFVPRLGSTDHEHHPSRTGDHLHYRDGRTERVGAATEA